MRIMTEKRLEDWFDRNKWQWESKIDQLQRQVEELKKYVPATYAVTKNRNDQFVIVRLKMGLFSYSDPFEDVKSANAALKVADKLTYPFAAR